MSGKLMMERQELKERGSWKNTGTLQNFWYFSKRRLPIKYNYNSITVPLDDFDLVFTHLLGLPDMLRLVVDNHLQNQMRPYHAYEQEFNIIENSVLLKQSRKKDKKQADMDPHGIATLGLIRHPEERLNIFTEKEATTKGVE